VRCWDYLDGYFHRNYCVKEYAMSDFATLRAAVLHGEKLVTVDITELAMLLDRVDELLAAAPPKKSRPKKAAPTGEACPLPDWLPLDAWNAFLDMRKAIKKPATSHAQALLVKKLTAFYANELDPGVILNQSIMNTWQDLYAPKEQSTALRSAAVAGRPVRGYPAPETDEARAARRNRWGMGGLEQGDSNAAK
jgi:hypothetical protein